MEKAGYDGKPFPIHIIRYYNARFVQRQHVTGTDGMPLEVPGALPAKTAADGLRRFIRLQMPNVCLHVILTAHLYTAFLQLPVRPETYLPVLWHPL